MTRVAKGIFGSHYRISHKFVFAATQAAGSRVFEIQNPDANMIVAIDRLRIQWLQIATHTAAIEDSLDVYKATGFSVLDTTNKVDLVASKLKTAYPAPVHVAKGVTVAGAAAGMTGGTLTLDTAPLAQLPAWLLAAQPTAGQVWPWVLDLFAEGGGLESPIELVQNEGIVISNRILLGAAVGDSIYIDAEISEYLPR